MSTSVSSRVAASLTRYNMLSPGDRLGVAVSGGADSVALLHLLHALSGYEITVLHVNHQLRGVESGEDEEFVRKLAQNLQLPIVVKQAAIGGGNLEQLARDGRRAFFAEARADLNLRCIALGHNQSDQAETVLYRFLRGSGLAGLSGMSPVTADGLIRPLLDISRTEIREWAAGQGIAWREDSSNQNKEFIRNRLRLDFVNPQLERVLAATSAVARDEEDWWRERISHLYSSLVQNGTIQDGTLGPQFQVAALRALHIAEQRRLMRYVIRQVKGDLRSIDVPHVDAILKLLETEAGHDRILIPGVDALRSFGTLLLSQPGTLGAAGRHFRIFLKIGMEMALPHHGGRLYVSRVKPEDRFCANFGMEAYSAQEVTDLDGEVLERAGGMDFWEIRNWEPGDEYRRAGHEKSEKIKSLFQEFRILLWERRRWPVLVVNGEIVWSRRFGAAAEFQATDESRNIVRILYSVGNGS